MKKFNNYYKIQKKLKFLIEITLEADASFTIGPKLSNILNQNGFYENEKLYQYIKDFFSKLITESDSISTVNFLVPMMFIFPKKKQKTLIYILNPFSNGLINTIIKLNVMDYYLYVHSRLFDHYFINTLHFNYIKKYLRFILIKKKSDFSILNTRRSFYFLNKKKIFYNSVFTKIKKKKTPLNA